MTDIVSVTVSPTAFYLKEFIPSIVTWNRLEGRPRKEDFDRSLRVEVRDALWMLTRQWQFGEFKGEDAGSAIKAKVLMKTSRINRYAMKGGKSVAYNDDLPLEARVEREIIPFDLSLRIQMGRHFMKLLKLSGRDVEYKAEYLAKYPLKDPANKVEEEALFSDLEAWQLFSAARGRIIDGAALLKDIQSGGHDSWVATNIESGDRDSIRDTASTFEDWFKRVYNQPEDFDDSAWAPSYLEYQFACSAPDDEDKQTVLAAEQYHHGHLDWYSFDIDSRNEACLVDKDNLNISDSKPEEQVVTFIPSPIEFGGMPNVRWWEMEDRQTDFGDINASTTDVAKLLLTEFGLIYGNDWSIIPFDLEVGTLSNIKGIVVTDVFGQRTFIRAAGRGPDDDWQRWSMYNLSTIGESGQVDNRLFLPPVIGKMLEGEPVEKVNLIRDEMANMVWAVENRIPGVTGQGIDGYEAAVALLNYIKSVTPPAMPPSPLQETDAAIRYLLGTSVPENWIPLIPVHVAGSNREIQLQRAAMPRLVGADSSDKIKPRGELLRHNLNEGKTYYIHEEEVPRAGAIVSRSYQRTRWWHGSIYVWLGRRKVTGRGEGSSGLQFDQIKPVEKASE